MALISALLLMQSLVDDKDIQGLTSNYSETRNKAEESIFTRLSNNESDLLSTLVLFYSENKREMVRERIRSLLFRYIDINKSPSIDEFETLMKVSDSNHIPKIVQKIIVQNKQEFNELLVRLYDRADVDTKGVILNHLKQFRGKFSNLAIDYLDIHTKLYLQYPSYSSAAFDIISDTTIKISDVFKIVTSKNSYIKEVAVVDFVKYLNDQSIESEYLKFIGTLNEASCIAIFNAMNKHKINNETRLKIYCAAITSPLHAVTKRAKSLLKYQLRKVKFEDFALVVKQMPDETVKELVCLSIEIYPGYLRELILLSTKPELITTSLYACHNKLDSKDIDVLKSLYVEQNDQKILRILFSVFPSEFVNDALTSNDKDVVSRAIDYIQSYDLREFVQIASTVQINSDLGETVIDYMNKHRINIYAVMEGIKDISTNNQLYMAVRSLKLEEDISKYLDNPNRAHFITEAYSAIDCGILQKLAVDQNFKTNILRLKKTISTSIAIAMALGCKNITVSESIKHKYIGSNRNKFPLILFFKGTSYSELYDDFVSKVKIKSKKALDTKSADKNSAMSLVHYLIVLYKERDFESIRVVLNSLDCKVLVDNSTLYYIALKLSSVLGFDDLLLSALNCKGSDEVLVADSSLKDYISKLKLNDFGERNDGVKEEK